MFSFLSFILEIYFAFNSKGFNDEDNKTIRTVNIFNQQVSIEYHSTNENKIDFFEQSVTLLGPGDDLSIFISNEWIYIENKQRNQSRLTVLFNETNPFLLDQYSSATHLVIGLNRNVSGTQTGIGLCLANITFIECYTDQRMNKYSKNKILLLNKYFFCLI